MLRGARTRCHCRDIAGDTRIPTGRSRLWQACVARYENAFQLRCDVGDRRHANDLAPSRATPTVRPQRLPPLQRASCDTVSGKAHGWSPDLRRRHRPRRLLLVRLVSASSRTFHLLDFAGVEQHRSPFSAPPRQPHLPHTFLPPIYPPYVCYRRRLFPYDATAGGPPSSAFPPAPEIARAHFACHPVMHGFDFRATPESGLVPSIDDVPDLARGDRVLIRVLTKATRRLNVGSCCKSRFLWW